MTGGSWQLSVGLRAAGSKLPPGGTRPARVNASSQVSQVLGFGTDDAQMDTECIVETVLDAGMSETFNLYSGLLDVFGDAADFRTLRSAAIWISDGGDDAGVTVGGAASNAHPLFWGGTTPTQTIYPNGPMAGGGGNVGVAVTNSVKNVKLVNNGAVSAVVRLSFAGSGAFGTEYFPGSNWTNLYLG